MPGLIEEIERVIFEAHPSLERDGAIDFDELLELRAGAYRDSRGREEAGLAGISDQIGIEMEKSREVKPLKAKIAEKEKLITRYEKDRKSLLPKQNKKTVERLQELVAAAEKVRGYLRNLANRKASIAGVRNEVRDLRQNQAPKALRTMMERFRNIGFDDVEWSRFLLEYSGDVNEIVAARAKEVEKSTAAWKGQQPSATADDSGAFVARTADLARTPLAILEAEIERLEKVVAADKETARKVSALSKPG